MQECKDAKSNLKVHRCKDAKKAKMQSCKSSARMQNCKKQILNCTDAKECARMQNHAKMQTQKKHARMQNCNKQGANAKIQKSMQECNTTKTTQRCKRSMQECKPEKKTKHRCERVCKSGKLQNQCKNANMQKRTRTQTCKKQGADAEQHKECNAARTLQRCKRSLREHKRAKRQKGGDAKAHASLHHLQNALPSPPYFSLSPSPPCSSPRVEVCQCLE